MFGRRGIPFLFGVGLVVILLIFVFYLMFHHGGGSSPNPNTPKPLASYANNPSAQVSLLIDGPVNAPTQHSQVQIVISNSTATINVFRGYNDTVANSKVYANTEAAFHVFLRSLEYAEFTNGHYDSSLSQASGYCPLGDRYIFSFNVNGSQKERYWTTNCGGGPHTFDGNVGLVLQLFQSQIPDYDSITSGANL